MIKIIIHITKFIIATITALLFASCNFVNTIEGSGNVTKEKRMVQGDFKKVSVNNAIELVIEQAAVTEIVVEADDNIQNDIKISVHNGTLEIHSEHGNFSNATRRVIVKMPIIDKIEASSAATVKSQSVIEGQNIELETSSAANMDINVESDNISLDSGSGSSINIEGKALTLKTSASSGSTIDAKRLLANEIDADASSGASLNIHPIVRLKAEASSGASINYDTTPKIIEKNTNSGGSINQG
ncbi:DUF2807 domain-containing protein [Flavobacterium sp. GA093]|uniref:DUF2807 domain-containing protein n=1 Tax=Flavobacterium hydrocarbonoxydans TaxID=2683249 RepID=A0A6I4NJP7_9FLAO|nr:head GIN domain-containing protein [Flavobacterium hydrocarbonoxydans]MWB94620.1 DUF2807 domain-containing protein [Flavobacterium hydrocarbonoxydans]